MTTVLILVLAALLVIVGLRQAVRGSAAEITGPEDLLQRTRPIDLIAFRNLLSQEDDAFLRAHLRGYALLRVRLARQRAAIEYVRILAYNAAILMRLGQTAKASSEQNVREASRELLSLAVETRILAGIALLQLYLSLLLPWWQPSLGAAAATYGQLRTALASVVMLQRPELATRITSAI